MPRVEASTRRALAAYSEAEHVVLANYFGVPPLVATSPDLASALDQLGASAGVDPKDDGPGPRPLDVAVARIALGQAQRRLPQCGIVSGGEVQLTRTEWSSRRAAIVQPRYLLGINWADSGPGVGWPEEYYATPLPLYDRWVVTASVDSPDVWGVTDWALGPIPVGTTDLVTASMEIIQRYWNALTRYREAGTLEDMWERVEGEGLIGKALAHRMRRKMLRFARRGTE